MSPARRARPTAPAGVAELPTHIEGFDVIAEHQEVASVFTADTSTLMGGQSITETHLSTVTDTIILLRYVEMSGEMRRGVTVLKMRGSAHDKRIREFVIDGTGMHVGQPFRGVAGILSGQLSPLPLEEERWSSPAQRDR